MSEATFAHERRPQAVAHLAIDLGASSGRAILGLLSGVPSRLELVEIHRFEHTACPTPSGPVWDITHIWHHLLLGLRRAVAECHTLGIPLRSLGVDTWGVDWAVVGAGGELLGLPHCYRDPRNEAACAQVLARLGGFARLYQRTGIQRLPFNTLFQLAACQTAEPQLLKAAHRLLFLPDLLHYWLSGTLATERTIASTGAMLDVGTGDWDRALLAELGLPTEILGELVEPGTDLGPLRREVAEATGAPPDVRVVTPAAHDTASAVTAVPATGDESAAAAAAGSGGTWAYVSSGTWSLLGAELPRPVTTAAAASVPFTNERGVGGTIRFLKNIGGLWLLQEIRRELPGDQRPEWGEITRLAAHAEPFRTLVDPNAALFVAPGQMAEKIRQFAQRTQQPPPEDLGQLARCCLDSLALCYRATADQLAEVLQQSIERLYVVGGGSENDLLNQLTADAMGCSVTCGPSEATAVGNLLIQAQACGSFGGTQRLRDIVARSFPVRTFQPLASAVDRQAMQQRFRDVLARNAGE